MTLTFGLQTAIQVTFATIMDSRCIKLQLAMLFWQVKNPQCYEQIQPHPIQYHHASLWVRAAVSSAEQPPERLVMSSSSWTAETHVKGGQMGSNRLTLTADLL